MGQHFLSELPGDRAFQRKQRIVCHPLGHLPQRVLSNIVYNAEVHIILNKWEKLGLISRNSTRVSNGSVIIAPHKNNCSFMVIGDLRNINCPLQ